LHLPAAVQRPADNRPERHGDDVNLEQSSTIYGNGKVDKKENVLSESEQVLRVLKLSVAILIARTKIRDFWAEGFEDAATLLDAVPLATSRFDSAKSHLANANVYCRQIEFGAATFELRALRGRLQSL
jgi:hypothetical protein